MKQHDEFIALYKELEDAIEERYVHERNDSESPVKWAEGQFPEKTSRLRYCRITRNYIQHEKDYGKFISISDEMMTFMREFVGELVGTAKTYCSTVKSSTVLCSDTVYDASVFLSKKNLKEVLVFDGKDIVGVISESDIVSAFASGTLTKKTKVSSIMKDLGKVVVQDVLENKTGLELILNETHFVIVRNKNGKVVGTIRGKLVRR